MGTPFRFFSPQSHGDHLDFFKSYLVAAEKAATKKNQPFGQVLDDHLLSLLFLTKLSDLLIRRCILPKSEHIWSHPNLRSQIVTSNFKLVPNGSSLLLTLV